jgi:hypothetical protein
MGFLNKLAKGFVRSGVNQVGRDGGRVVSNKVYGDKHSIPIRHIKGDSQSDNIPPDELSFSQEDIKSSGYKAELFEDSWIMMFVTTLGAFVFPVLGPLYYLIQAFKNLFKKHTKHITYEKREVHVKDGRYKSGTRVDGYEKVKVYYEGKIEATQSERIIYFLKGLINLAIAIGSGYFQYFVYTVLST